MKGYCWKCLSKGIKTVIDETVWSQNLGFCDACLKEHRKWCKTIDPMPAVGGK
jgi:hypothetical protein